MKRNRHIKIVASGVVLTLAVWTLVSCENRKLLLYNHTPSVPIGWYVYAGRSPQVGDIIAFTLPSAAHEYARSRGEPIDVRLLKPVIAAAGDRVSTLDGELRVNGVSFGMIAVTDAAGRTLPHWQADGVLKANELAVGSAMNHSFDSRFFGPIHATQISGVYRRLTIGSTGDALAEPTPSLPSVRIGVTPTTSHR